MLSNIINSDISVVAMRRVPIIFLELVVIKKFHANILNTRHFMIILLIKKLCLIATVSNINRIILVMHV